MTSDDLTPRQANALADKAGLALRSIIESVTRSSQLMAEIASSTGKQSQASAEVQAHFAIEPDGSFLLDVVTLEAVAA